MTKTTAAGKTPDLPRYNLNDITKYTQPKKAGGFRRFLGALTGGVANVVMPGVGSLIGNYISGGGISTQGGHLADSMQFLELQREINMETRLFEMVSNILKVRHDVAMSAIRNIN